MNINLLAVVAHKQITKKTKNSDYDNTWNPDPENGDQWMPNFAAIWVDHYWSGICCESEAIVVGKKNQEMCSIFNIVGTMQPRKASSMQKSIWPTKRNSENISVCNSIKIHFFKASVEDCADGNSEDRKDFLFSTSFPLHSPGAAVYGLFNYNSHDRSSEILDNFRVVIFNTHISIPKEVTVLLIPGPNQEHHNEVLEFGSWTANVLRTFSPQLKSSFADPRTILRDQNSTWLFQNLRSMFDLAGTSLPPTLACYTLCNALIVNRISPKDFASELYLSDKSSIGIPEMLRVLRDTIAGMTMCAHEGKYWADTSIKQSVEDQPFPLSFLPSKRLFQKDDCEGRITQAQEMVTLLRCMSKTAKQYGLDVFINMMLKIPTNVSRMALSSQNMTYIVRGCVNLGNMLQENRVEVHTVVGDVCFAAFTASASLDATTEDQGHSFGVIIYNDGRRQGCTILEATGWERTELPSDRPILPAEILFLKQLSQSMSRQRNNSIVVCGQLPKIREDSVYKHMYLGNDCMFFRPDVCHLHYGPGLSDFRNGFYTFPDIPTFGSMFKISTVNFLQELCKLENDIKNSKKPPTRILWPHITKADTDVVNAIQGAGKMLENYTKIQARMSYSKRCLATPSKTEEQFKALMRPWAIISENILPIQTRPCAGVMFSIPEKSEVCPILASLLSQGMLEKHQFMQSTIMRFMA